MMDKQEKAAQLRKLIKLFRKQGKSANESRKLAGEAMRLMAQGQQWQDKAQRQADKLENYMGKCVVEEIDGVAVTTLPPKNTRRTYKNNGCRISAKAKTTSNAIFMDVAQGKGRSKAIYRSQDSGNLALTSGGALCYRFTKMIKGKLEYVEIVAKTAAERVHLRNMQLAHARRNVKRQLIKAMLYRMRSRPEHAATIWQVTAHVSVDYDAILFNGVKARNAAYNANLPASSQYNHAAFLQSTAGVDAPEREFIDWQVSSMLNHL